MGSETIFENYLELKWLMLANEVKAELKFLFYTKCLTSFEYFLRLKILFWKLENNCVNFFFFFCIKLFLIGLKSKRNTNNPKDSKKSSLFLYHLGKGTFKFYFLQWHWCTTSFFLVTKISVSKVNKYYPN